MIRDRLVVGIRDKSLSERLQMDADLTKPRSLFASGKQFRSNMKSSNPESNKSQAHYRDEVQIEF